MPPTRVAVVGDNCIDVYVGGDARSAVGGNALNVAVDLARLGIAVAYIGEVGDDDNGRRVVAAAEAAGVSMSGIHVVEGRTWVASIALDHGGSARVVDEDPGACGPYFPRDGELELLTGFDHVHMANMAAPSTLIRQLREQGVGTSYDFGKTDRWASGDLPSLAFASCDGDGAVDRGMAIARAACTRGAEIAVVTLGPAGSLAFDGTRVYQTPAMAIEPIDTLGAGDSYIAAFLASRLAGSSLEVAMAAASDAASETCRHWACWPQPALAAPSGRGRA